MTLPIGVEGILNSRAVESDRLEFKEGWNPDKIRIYNLGGLDRSIRLADLIAGTVVPRRYRNRRLGDFLKEMKLTEGRLTGIQLITSTLERNGSPNPLFETDDERTWFSVMLYKHPAFSNTASLVEHPKDTSVSRILTELLCKTLSAYYQANDQADDQANDQAVLEKMEKMLLYCVGSEKKRDDLLDFVGLKRHMDSIKRYIEPLERIGWLEKTIPEKPTSPLQKYRLGKVANEAVQMVKTDK